jgi:surface polysaccharide O-acyltransferase-like enzyme
MSLPAERIANIDRLRVLAAIGIVWFHADEAPYRHIAYAGLPIFLLIFCSLLTSQARETTTVEMLRRRCGRLLKPWLFWSAIYGLCRLTKALSAPDTGSAWAMLSTETLLAGTSIHLWYLPYAFLWSLVIYTLNRRTSHIRGPIVVLTAMVVGMTLLAIHATGTWDDLGRPLPQWEFGLAAIPFGFAIGRCLTVASRERRRLFLVTIAMVVAIECQILYRLGFGPQVLPHGIGVTLVCVAYCWEVRGGTVIASLAPLAFGVYLIHPLVAYALRALPAINGHHLVVIPLTVCISALATLVLMRTPLKQFV